MDTVDGSSDEEEGNTLLALQHPHRQHPEGDPHRQTQDEEQHNGHEQMQALQHHQELVFETTKLRPVVKALKERKGW
jgi:hypothetical protein